MTAVPSAAVPGSTPMLRARSTMVAIGDPPAVSSLALTWSYGQWAQVLEAGPRSQDQKRGPGKGFVVPLPARLAAASRPEQERA